MTDAERGEARGVSLGSVGRAAAILTGATVGVQMLAIVRELFLAANVGLSADLDALLIGLVLPTMLVSILTSGPSTALVPAYLEARTTHGPAAALKLAGTVMLWLSLIGLALTLFLEVIAPFTVAITGPGLSEASRESATLYLRVFAPTVFVAGVSGSLYAVLQAEGRFSAIAWATFSGAVVSLLSLVLFYGQLGLGAFALGNLLGPTVAMGMMLAGTIRARVVPRPGLRARGLGLRAYTQHATPLTISGAILQINAVFDRAIASLFGAGSVSALRYGDTLIRVPTGAISPAWGAAIYPALVKSTQGSDPSGLAEGSSRSLHYVTVIFMPLAVLTLAVAPLGVAVAYGRGAFTEADLQLTSQVVAAFAPLVLVLMLSQTLTGSLNALRKGRILLAAGIINVIVNCTLDVALGWSMGVAGIALSSSVTAIVVSTFKAWRFRRLQPAFNVRPLLSALGRSFIASTPAAVVIGAALWTGHYPGDLLGRLVLLIGCVTGGMLLYIAIADRLYLHEPRMLLTAIVSRLTRGRTPAGAHR